jgi:hypothetical protein
MYCAEQRGLVQRGRRAEAAAQGKSGPAALTSGSVAGRTAAGCRTPRLVDGRERRSRVLRLPNARIWKRLGSDKPQQRAAAMCGPSLVERLRRQTAADRSSCSRLTSRRSPVRAGHRPSSRATLRRGTAASTPDHCRLSREAQAGVRTRPPRHRRDPPLQNRGPGTNHRTLTSDRRG